MVLEQVGFCRFLLPTCFQWIDEINLPNSIACSGKTSLLNALCGRAYYGEVHGEIYVNGQLLDIKEIQDSVGFVPQDDIVYAELTVRENLIYTGKFLLPKGTSIAEIEELADETIASLGLARVANSLVGDVKRRGVSGGEKKRVNIGLELMKRPACVFLVSLVHSLRQ